MTQDPQVVGDPELLKIVSDAFDKMLGRWEDTIAAAVVEGELPAQVVPRELARTLAAVLQLTRAQLKQPDGSWTDLQEQPEL